MRIRPNAYSNDPAPIPPLLYALLLCSSFSALQVRRLYHPSFGSRCCLHSVVRPKLLMSLRRPIRRATPSASSLPTPFSCTESSTSLGVASPWLSFPICSSSSRKLVVAVLLLSPQFDLSTILLSPLHPSRHPQATPRVDLRPRHLHILPLQSAVHLEPLPHRVHRQALAGRRANLDEGGKGVD